MGDNAQAMTAELLPSGRKFQTHSRPRASLLLLTWLIASLMGLGPLHADQRPAYRGRPLVEVLRELKEQGLRLIFSSAVVKPDLVVINEATATDPRAILDELLPPLGLRAEEGPGGSILILAASRATGLLRGHVRSTARRWPIAGAVLRIPDLAQAIAAGPDGSFEFEALPEGLYDLIAEAPGFKAAKLTRIRVSSRRAAAVVVWMQELPGFVTEVVVTPSQLSVVEQDLAARRTVGSEDAVLAPSFGGEISRVIELLPGVTAPDNSAAFHIRGSLPRDASFVLDGLELYDPYHLATFQSPFTLIDSNIVDRVDFSGGGFTADFGDRHGGRLEILTVLPDASHRGEVEIGTMNSRISYVAPSFGGSGSWLVSARGWYPEAHQDTIELGGGERVDPRFGDLYAKGVFTVSPRSVVSVHGLAAYDRLSFVDPEDEVGQESETANALTRNGYLWMTLLNSWSPAANTETVVSIGSIDRQRDGLSQPQDDASLVDDDRVVRFVGLRHGVTLQPADPHVIKAGFEVRRLNARYRYFSELLGDPSSARSIQLDPAGTSLGAYVAYRARIARDLTTEAGVRWDRQDYTKDTQFSPRLNAVWLPGDRTELRLGVGRYSQSQRIHELQIEDGEETFHRAEESDQAEISLLHRVRGGLRFRLDAYHRRISNPAPRYENLFQPVELFPETSSDRVRIAPSEARLQGVELMLLGEVERPLTWWISYAFSSAKDAIGSDEILRSWDQTHSGKFLAGYRRGERWLISLSGTAHTGWPTTPKSATLTTLPGGQIRINEILGERNSDRFDTYFRLDAKVRRSFPLSRGRLAVTAEVINLTDQKNPCCVDEFLFDPQPDGSVDVERIFEHWRGLTPSFSLLWEF